MNRGPLVEPSHFKRTYSDWFVFIFGVELRSEYHQESSTNETIVWFLQMGKRCPNKKFSQQLSQDTKFLTTNFPNFLTIARPLEYLQSEPRHASTEFAVRNFTTPSVLLQYFPNAIKKFPNQMLRNIPWMDFNAKFARCDAVGHSESYIWVLNSWG